MTEIGVRQLKQQVSDILRRVREKREVITITYRGRAVARLVPVEDAEGKQAESEAVWVEMDRLAQEVGAYWPKGQSALEAVQEQRRGL